MKLNWDTCLKAGVTVFGLYLCITYWPVLGALVSALVGAAAPLLIGCVIAYLVNILMSFYEKHYFPRSKKAIAVKSRRPVCMIGAFVTFVAVIALVAGLVIPELVSCVSVIIAALSEVITDVAAFLMEREVLSIDLYEKLAAIDWQSKIGGILSSVLSGVGNVMDVVVTAVSGVFSGVVTGLLALIFAIYLLSGKETLGRQCRRLMKRYLKPAWIRKLDYVLAIVNECFRKYFVGQCIEAVILGTLCAIGMALLGLPYATMVGAVVAVTALIPVAGAYIGGAVGALMIFSVSPIQAVVFLVYLVVLQQLEGNLIYPRVVGSSLGLPAIWVLAAVTIGGGIMGITGMLLSVPLASALYRILKDDLNHKK